jgi:hypothetical protein
MSNTCYALSFLVLAGVFHAPAIAEEKPAPEPAPATAAEKLAPEPAACPHGLILIVDGAGGFQGAAKSLSRAVAEQCLPFDVEPFHWSHGYMRILSDYLDLSYSEEAASRLAATILLHKEQHPEQKIIVVVHSAGSLLVLLACKSLPPDCVERIIMLAPSVSNVCDVRPGLIVARQGVDVFYSVADWYYLGIGSAVLGTSDHRYRPAAGMFGFKKLSDDPADACLYSKLHQYAWHPGIILTGNFGGHFGVHKPDFVKTYVVPLLTLGDEPPPAATCCPLQECAPAPAPSK